MLKSLYILLGGLLALYLVLVVLVYIYQRQMIYFPSHFSEADLLKEAGQSGLKPWRNSKGELIGWIAPHPNSPADARVIVLHGNANHAHWCDHYAQAFQSIQSHHWDVYLLEYPGYASRPGVTSETSLVKACIDAIDELKATDKSGSPQTFLVGESIGAAVACQAASQRPDAVDGMFFIAPFNNLTDVGQAHMPILPVSLLLKDRYTSDEALKKLTAPREGRNPTGLPPIAFLTGGRDRVVPNRFTQKLFDGYQGPKKLWTQPASGHNTFHLDPTEPFWKEIDEFLFANSGNRRGEKQ